MQWVEGVVWQAICHYHVEHVSSVTKCTTWNGNGAYHLTWFIVGHYCAEMASLKFSLIDLPFYSYHLQ